MLANCSTKYSLIIDSSFAIRLTENLKKLRVGKTPHPKDVQLPEETK